MWAAMVLRKLLSLLLYYIYYLVYLNDGFTITQNNAMFCRLGFTMMIIDQLQRAFILLFLSTKSNFIQYISLS